MLRYVYLLGPMEKKYLNVSAELILKIVHEISIVPDLTFANIS